MSRLYPLIQLAAALALGASARAETDFNRDIRPILNRNCTGCHGGVKQAGGISFVYQELALGEGKSGARTILPGNPDGSEVIRRVLSRDAEEQMPPQDHGGGKPLPAAEIALLRQWIAEGARWGDHWAFVKPQPQPVPAVKNAAWPVNDIDRFILAKLESENLAPSKAAAPAQWLRRATLDLTGLPPSPEELADFERGPSYEKAVDRLLASPHFGERWAAMWMDLARYADTQGYEKDNGREIWPWRDWVIRAFNAGMPYDQFTVKQLAGDLLPDASIDDRVATGFHRNTQTNTEGGTNDEEFRLHAVIDRVNTTWTVWQGTTFGCVQCHSHPYDSFRHDDYYRFLSIFNSTEDADLGDDFPRVKVPFEPGKYSEAEALDDEISSLRLKLNATADAATTPWTPLPPVGIKGPEDARFITTENEVRVGGTVPNGALYTIELPRQTAFTALRIDLLPQKDDPKQWPELGAVLGHLWMELEDPVKRAAARLEAGKIKSGASGQEAGGDGKTGDSNALPPGVQRIGFHAVYADTLTGPFDPEESLTAGPGGGGAFPALLGPRWLVFVPQQPVQVPPGAVLRLQLKHEIFDAETKGAILYHFKIGASLDPAWTRLANDPERSGLQNRLAEARRKREAIPSASSLVMQERPPEARRETRVFLRGNFLAKDKVVQGGTPAILPQLPPGPADRLAVARWLVSPENPLTARVIVNRLWAELFGTGIIGTLEDFGSTGLPPSHPALLDFLALRFQQEQGWSFKALLRELVLSSTYRQDHRTSPAQLARDPHNHLLGRGPRTRLTAEMVRDQALAASGLLSRQTGGAPVMPPQPDGVWQVVYNGSAWITPEGPDRYRRALYTYWRRTSPYPSFMTFDAASREVCSARRIVTNTPLQALVTLNDPVYFEAAQALARRMIAAAGDTEARIAWALRCVTAREPRAADIARLTTLFETAKATYTADPLLSAKAGPDATTAALTQVASTLLNLDEAFTK